MDATGGLLGRLDSTRTPGLLTGRWHVPCSLPRAVVGRCDCRLLEKTTFGFPIRMMPMWSSGDRAPELESVHSPHYWGRTLPAAMLRNLVEPARAFRRLVALPSEDNEKGVL